MDRELFLADPSLFLQKAIKDFVARSESNRLASFGGTPIWDEPLVGFAAADDPLFAHYRTVVGPHHLTPREALGQAPEDEARPASVISIVLPCTRETRLSLRHETSVPSLRWNHTRWHGQDFINLLADQLVSLLQGLEHRAVAPERAPYFRIKELANGLASNWSQRHVAYAAGLGTFSLNDALITPKGIAVRLTSVVCDLELPATPRPHNGHTANCLFYRGGSCRRCIERCPAGAISEQGHDKVKCRAFLFNEQKARLEALGREGYVGRYPGCGLCQTKVPCEDRVPPAPLSSATS